MKQAIIYCRFSPRPDAKESKSNEKQGERCRKYCKRRGYKILGEGIDNRFGIFSDKAISGKTLGRPGLTAAINYLEPGMVLVVDTRDRLARDMLVSLTIHQQVREKGATIEIADGSPSRETPEGNLMANILDAFAQYERESFARRTKAGLAKKKKEGVWLGKPPIGWKLDGETKQLMKCPEEQKAIEYILNMDKYGDKSSKIADILNHKMGFLLSCRGKPWSARTIRKIIAREKQKSS